MAHPTIAPAFITLGGNVEGRLGPKAYTMALRARSDSLAPSHVSAAAPARAHTSARASYQVSGLQGFTGQ